jgi:hypothetical protein
LEEILPGVALRYFSLGRWALVEALRLASAGPGKKVLLPGYLCREVVASVRALGAEPVFYQVTPGFELAVPPKDLPEACAIMAADFFGFSQDLAPFEEYCRRTGALLIEDNAHGLFSRDGQGRALGCRAPLGVFSLRKTLPLPNGGALAVNDPSLAGRVAPELPFLPQGAGRRGLLRSLAPLFGARGVWSLIHLSRRWRALRTGCEIPPPDPEGEERISGGPEPCAELGRPLLVLDPAQEAARRRSLYGFCEELLSGIGIRPVFKSLPEGTVPYVFPYRASGQALDKSEERLNRQGLSSLPWPDLPQAVAPTAPAYYQDVRGVHFLW